MNMLFPIGILFYRLGTNYWFYERVLLGLPKLVDFGLNVMSHLYS